MNTHRVEYLLVGGYAVNLHGFVRATGDMNVFVFVNVENTTHVLAALHDFGFPGATPELVQKGKMLRMGVPPVRIEVLTEISGVTFEECYAQRVTVELAGLSVPMIDLASLRKNKLASGRAKDLADLSQLPEE